MSSTHVPTEHDRETPKSRFIDIGGIQVHPPQGNSEISRKEKTYDLEAVLERSRAAGVESMIITGGSLSESRHALDLAKAHSLYATVGCHPTRSGQFDSFKGGPEAYQGELDKLISTHLKGPGRVVAVGECGLDYDRTHFASPETQKTHFRSQLALAKKYHLPLFLHSRAAHSDFVEILRAEGFGSNGGKDVGGKGGVVHSFTGTTEELCELMDMGFYISVNGCSLKTESNLRTAKTIRLDRLMLETDAPWCTMTSAHASKAHLDKMPQSLRNLYLPPGASRPEKFIEGKSVKGRNEPMAIGGVAWVMSSLLDIPLEDLTGTAFSNTIELFGLTNEHVDVVQVA